MYYVVSIIGFLFVFGIVVFVHELGHFVTAKYNDVEVNAFSLGMGPNVFAHEYGETEYRIGILPLGGYVSMEGEDPTEASDNPRAFYNKSVWPRTAILLAGCVFNFLLGLVIYYFFGIFVGEAQSPPKVGYVQEDKPAYGKLKIGDEILSLNGNTVNTFRDIMVRNELLGNQTRKFVVKRNGQKERIRIEPEKVIRDQLNQPAYVVGIMPYIPPIIKEIDPSGRASELGFKPGDRLVAYNETPVKSWTQFSQLVKNSRGKVELTIQRNGERISKTLTVPENDKELSKWGRSIGWQHPVNLKYYGPIGSFGYSVNKTIETVRIMYEGVVGLITQRLSPKSLAGPVGITQMTANFSNRGIIPLLGFAAFFSINLGILNLLPIPVLDGGHILLSIPEMLTGRSLPNYVIRTFNYIGLSLLLTLFVYVTKVDLCRFEWFQQFFGFVCRL